MLDLILERQPNTLLLMVSATALSLRSRLAARVVAGTAALTDRSGAVDWRADALRHPGFWLGLVLVLIFSVVAALLPLAGSKPSPPASTAPPARSTSPRHLCLPVVALGVIYLALFLRVMRASMAESWRQDFILAAKPRASPGNASSGHVVRAALLPVVTVLGLQAAGMLGGSVVIESVFAISRLRTTGAEAVAAAMRRY